LRETQREWENRQGDARGTSCDVRSCVGYGLVPIVFFVGLFFFRNRNDCRLNLILKTRLENESVGLVVGVHSLTRLNNYVHPTGKRTTLTNTNQQNGTGWEREREREHPATNIERRDVRRLIHHQTDHRRCCQITRNYWKFVVLHCRRRKRPCRCLYSVSSVLCCSYWHVQEFDRTWTTADALLRRTTMSRLVIRRRSTDVVLRYLSRVGCVQLTSMDMVAVRSSFSVDRKTIVSVTTALTRWMNYSMITTSEKQTGLTDDSQLNETHFRRLLKSASSMFHVAFSAMCFGFVFFLLFFLSGYWSNYVTVSLSTEERHCDEKQKKKRRTRRRRRRRGTERDSRMPVIVELFRQKTEEALKRSEGMKYSMVRSNKTRFFWSSEYSMLGILLIDGWT
jgi:hypothetical protein